MRLAWSISVTCLFRLLPNRSSFDKDAMGNDAEPTRTSLVNIEMNFYGIRTNWIRRRSVVPKL